MELTPLYDKKMDCINCKSKFTTKRVRSKFVRVSSHDTDFKPVYSNPDANPLLYNVAVCPKCGFSYTDDFVPYFGPGTKETIEKQITSQWNERNFGDERTTDEAIETYKLAYLSSMFKKEKALTSAGLTLRIAWLYRNDEKIEEENRFLKIARDLYLEAYSEGDYVGTQMSETRVTYIIAELSFRIGDRSEAVRNFSRVIENQRTSNEPHIIDMAKERWQEIREEKEKE